jgi:hypothetical protein
LSARFIARGQRDRSGRAAAAHSATDPQRDRRFSPRAPHLAQQPASFATLGYWKTLDEDYHWHIEILPILEAKARSYTFKEIYYSPVTSETAVKRLREAKMPGALEGVRNDSGVIFVDNRPYILCVMSTYLRRERDGEDAIANISLAAWRMFDRLARASEYGRVISPGNSGSR